MHPLVVTLLLSASPQFPGDLQSYLMLNNAPSCNLCHQSAVGSAGTAQKPFARALIARGLVAEDPQALQSAIDALDRDGTDSDGDGVSDVNELHAGTDPNVADAGGGGAGGGAGGGGTVAGAAGPVQYGCASTASSSWFALPLGLLALLFRRRSRRGVTKLGALVLGAGALAGCGVPLGFSEDGPRGGEGGGGFTSSGGGAGQCSSGAWWNGGNEESALMHPGVDCIGCHRSGEGEGPRFAIAGTVMSAVDDVNDCLGVEGVTVEILDNNGVVAATMQSNAAGNFYARNGLAANRLPYTARVTSGGRTVAMATPQSDGNCLHCHTQSGANGAPGRIVAP